MYNSLKHYISGKKVLILFFITISLLAGNIQAGENLFFNSSFEMGDAGYSMIKFLRFDNNTELKFVGLKVDNTTSVSGKYSLVIPNPYSEMLEFYSNELTLKPDTNYEFSLYLKTDVDKLPVMVQLYSAKNHKFEVKSRVYTIDKEWRKYTLSFKTDIPGKFNSEYFKLKIRSCWKKDTPKHTIWLDELSLTEGKSEKWQAAADIEATFASDKSCYIGSEKLQTRIIVRNNSSKKQRVRLNGVAVDNDRGKKILSKPVDVSLAAHETKMVPCKFNLTEYGAYDFTIKLVGNSKMTFKSLPFSIVVMGKYKGKPVDVSNDFVMSCSTAMYRKARGVDTDNPGLCCWNIGLDDKYALFNQAGIRLIRDFTTFLWQNIEPEENQFKYAMPDSVVKAAAESGIQIMPVLGGMTMIDRGGAGKPPEWLKKVSQKIDKFPLKHKYTKGALYLPPEEIWNRYVRNMVKRYKGKIQLYEKMNEPNLMFYDASHYLKYLKPAYKIIRKEDPAAKTVGLCVTGDLGGNIRSFQTKCMELDAKKYCDIISFHPYDARRLSSRNPADRQIEDLKNVIKKYPGSNIPVLNSELFFLKDGVSTSVYQPQDLVFRTLTDLGEGVKQSISVLDSSLWRPTCPNINFDSSTYVPSGAFVALNAMARIFEGAKPVEKIRWGSDTICYVFERKGKYVAAFWKYGNLKDVKVRLPLKNSQAQLYDLYGNPLSLKRQTLPLEDLPYYLSWKGRSKEQFISLLKDSQISLKNPLVAADSIRLLKQSDIWYAYTALQNYSTQALTVKIDLRGKAVRNTSSIKTTIPGNSEKTVKIPVKFLPGADKAVIKVSLLDKTFNFPVNVIKTPYAQPGKIQNLKFAMGTGKATHRVRFKTTQKGDIVTLYFEVKDNTPSGKPGTRSLWDQDAVELFFDLNPEYFPLKYAGKNHDEMLRMFFLPYADKQFVMWGKKGVSPNNFKYEIKTSSAGYAIKLDIPVSALHLDTDTDTIGFDIKVDNAVGAQKATSALTWSSHGQAHADRLSLGSIDIGNTAIITSQK